MNNDEIRQALVASLYAIGHPTPDSTVEVLMPVIATTVNIVRRDIARKIVAMEYPFDLNPAAREVRDLAAQIAQGGA